jgi:lysozyme family protein
MTYLYTNARRADLARRFDAMKVLRQQGEIDREADAIIAKRAIYKDIESATRVPWWLVGVIDTREGGTSHLGTRHLHDGDPLTNYTVNVPAGRPAVGHRPPFTFRESAIDALKMKGLQSISNWTVERALHILEPYNGLGYFNGPTDFRGVKHPPMPTPYNWACTDQYDPPHGPGGKYTRDHYFDPDATDGQIGCAPLIAAIARRAGIALPREADALSLPHPVDLAKAGGGPIIVAGAAAVAHAQGVPAWMIAVAILAIGAVAMGVYMWRQHAKGV